MISPQPVIPRATRAVNRVNPQPTCTLSGRSRDARINRQFRRLADSIVKEFPRASGGTILFSGAGSNRHIAEVAEQVAQQLALQLDGTVILVDGNAEQQILSEQLNADSRSGLAEVLQQQVSLARVTQATGIHNVQFLPFGDRRTARNPIATSAVQAFVADLRQLYRYVIIASGTGTNPIQAMLSRHCDGTYLVVQIGVAERQETSDLAHYLTRAGARLLGCVATSVV